MAIELEKINFTDYEEPSVSSATLNNMQEKMQTALNKAQETLIAGDNINIENNVISVTGGGSGENKQILYSNATGTTGQNSLTLLDNYNNYTELEITFDICNESGTKKYFGFINKVNIENSKTELMIGFAQSKIIYATFNLTDNNKLTITRNRQCENYNAPVEGNYLYITKVVGII